MIQPSTACSKITNSRLLRSRIGIVSRGDCMFVEKARYLEKAQSIAGIVIDSNLKFPSSNIGMFSMNGDGNDNVHIPLVLMFRNQADQLTKLLFKSFDVIFYMGDEQYLKRSFYQQLDHLNRLIEPSSPWIYGQIQPFHQQCSVLSKQLKLFEEIIHQPIEIGKYLQ